MCLRNCFVCCNVWWNDRIPINFEYHGRNIHWSIITQKKTHAWGIGVTRDRIEWSQFFKTRLIGSSWKMGTKLRGVPTLQRAEGPKDLGPALPRSSFQGHKLISFCSTSCNGIRCRRTRWTDCFRASTTSRTFRAMTSLRSETIHRRLPPPPSPKTNEAQMLRRLARRRRASLLQQGKRRSRRWIRITLISFWSTIHTRPDTAERSSSVPDSNTWSANRRRSNSQRTAGQVNYFVAHGNCSTGRLSCSANRVFVELFQKHTGETCNAPSAESLPNDTRWMR